MKVSSLQIPTAAAFLSDLQAAKGSRGTTALLRTNRMYLPEN